MNVFHSKIILAIEVSLQASFRREYARVAAFKAIIAVSKGFKSYYHIFRFTPSVFNNFWHLTIAAENLFLSGLA